ncbi:undecaprenyl-diphosphate phosphatase [Marinomonas algicola]|uniref:undecaprenyl-diphosphate phosphatase n=1 Tax=Marinomonas algicola TaxID=2773454 RepID=UPI00174A6993|nr:undecaprenyl-diphosphate phosphatase [Marinomonas algicola]
MIWYHIVFLSIIQGVTEFLPISSSAHLILPSQLLGWPDQGLAFDVAVHVGTLIAVMSYFRQDIFRLMKAWFSSVSSAKSSDDSKLSWLIIVSTIPAVLIGLLFNDFIESHLRSIDVIAYTTIGFGVLLWLSDYCCSQEKTEFDLTFTKAVYIGFAQALALIPGTSRSGITITAARSLGLTRDASARFSFLLSIPLIIAAGSYKLVELLLSGVEIHWGVIFSGVALSALSAYICIYCFLKWLNQIGFTPFLFYRLLLGGILLAISYLTL